MVAQVDKHHVIMELEVAEDLLQPVQTVVVLQLGQEQVELLLLMRLQEQPYLMLVVEVVVHKLHRLCLELVGQVLLVEQVEAQEVQTLVLMV